MNSLLAKAIHETRTKSAIEKALIKGIYDLIALDLEAGEFFDKGVMCFVEVEVVNGRDVKTIIDEEGIRQHTDEMLAKYK